MGQALPGIVTQDDAQVLCDLVTRLHNASDPFDVQRCIRQLALAWEDYFLPKYPIPFFQVRVADVRAAGGSLSTALELYDEVRRAWCMQDLICDLSSGRLQALYTIGTSPESAPFSNFVTKLRSQAQGDAQKEGESLDHAADPPLTVLCPQPFSNAAQLSTQTRQPSVLPKLETRARVRQPVFVADASHLCARYPQHLANVAVSEAVAQLQLVAGCSSRSVLRAHARGMLAAFSRFRGTG